MEKIRTSKEIDHTRRHLLGAAALSLAAAPFALGAPASAQSAALPAIKPGTNTSLGPIKQVNAGLLNVGYAEMGPAGGPPVILLHGWPYDIHSFADVAPLLASAGYRVIVPHLRGYGSTRFLAADVRVVAVPREHACRLLRALSPGEGDHCRAVLRRHIPTA